MYVALLVGSFVSLFDGWSVSHSTNTQFQQFFLYAHAMWMWISTYMSETKENKGDIRRYVKDTSVSTSPFQEQRRHSLSCTGPKTRAKADSKATACAPPKSFQSTTVGNVATLPRAEQETCHMNSSFYIAENGLDLTNGCGQEELYGYRQCDGATLTQQFSAVSTKHFVEV